MFKCEKTITHIPRIKLGDCNLKYSKNLKYLGIIFYNRSWIPHVNSLKYRIDNSSYKVRNIARATWGLNPSVIKNICLLIIEKIILYGCKI